MKIKMVLILLLVVGLVFVAGCSSSDYGGSAPPSGPVGGGCGVIGPENTDASNAVEKINSIEELF